MRWGWLLAVAAMATPAFAADQTVTTVGLTCAQADPGNPACNPSRTDQKKAKNAFSRGLHLEKAKHLDEAYQEFDSAARLVPTNLDYQTALALTREELISQYVRGGNADLEKGLAVQAQAAFRSALMLDPDNEFAQQQLQSSMTQWAPEPSASVQIVNSAGPLEIEPKPEHHDFHFRGDSHALFAQLAETFGVSVEVDQSVASKHVHFYIDDVDFFAAMRAACEVTGSFWTAVTEKQVFVVKDTQENHRLYDRMAMRTFYVGFATTPQEMQEVNNLLRTIFEIRFVQPEVQTNRIVVRAPVAVLDAATQFLDNFGTARPQVMLDIQVFEVDRQLAHDIGVHIPDTFNIYNLPAAAFLALGGQNIQSLINQLIASGGINQANSSALSGLLAQLQGQQGQNSIFSQPLATFGGGLTLTGVTLDRLTTTLSRNESLVKLLDHATLRAAQGNEASFKLGQRYPVINASFAPIFNSSAISQVLQNGSFQAPIPSFSYEDLGLDIKAKPIISPNYDVGLQLEMQMRSLAGQSLNGVPVIASRSFKSNVNLENGEPAIVASSMTITEMRTINGVPGLGSLPLLRNLSSETSTSEERDELLVLITPHIVNLESTQSTEVWLPR